MTGNPKKVLIIPHGGSGHGVTYWSGYAEGCLLKADLRESLAIPCQQVADYFRFGTIFHLLMTANGTRADQAGIEIVDEQCGPWKDEILDEGWRIYNGYWDWLDGKPEFGDGQVIARELLVSGPALDGLVGIDDCAGTIDVIVQKPGGAIWIYDYKTAGRSGSSYTGGTYMLQRWMYSLCAQALGYEVEKFVFRQIVKTKTITVNDYEMLPPSPAEIKMLRNYVQFAQAQKARGVRGPHLGSCKSCLYKDNPCMEGM